LNNGIDGAFHIVKVDCVDKLFKLVYILLMLQIIYLCKVDVVNNNSYVI
jgi:hypothetical protein